MPTIRNLAELDPTTLALMHGPAYAGDGRTWSSELADSYADRTAALTAA